MNRSREAMAINLGQVLDPEWVVHSEAPSFEAGTEDGLLLFPDATCLEIFLGSVNTKRAKVMKAWSKRWIETLKGNSPSVTRSRKTTYLEQYLDAKAKYPGHVVLSQCGCFFDVYESDANVIQKVFKWEIYRHPMLGCAASGVGVDAIENAKERLREMKVSFIVLAQVDDRAAETDQNKGVKHREIVAAFTCTSSQAAS